LNVLKSIAIVLFAPVLFAAGCNVNTPQGQASPTVEALPSATIATEVAQSLATQTAVPTRTLPSIPVLESPTASFTPGPPTATFTPTDTPGPIEHTVQADDTLYYIIQLYGYTDISVIDQIVAMNPNIPSADRLPGPGAVILIPRPTATATPEGFEPSPVPPGVTVVPVEAQLMDYTIKDGETILGVAMQNNVTLAQLDQLNPELQFFNCDFSNPSGGPDCNVPLSVGQIVKVPAPTPTPTLSPTPSGSETPTPTPTYVPPMLIFPPEGATAQGGSIQLQWVSVGILPPGYYYGVEVNDAEGNPVKFSITRETSFTLGSELAPAAGTTRELQWRVRVGTVTEDSIFHPSGAESTWRALHWRG
jgi:hypothetical protein